MTAPIVVLASASQIRAEMLSKSGVPIEILPANIDEDSIKESLRAEGASARHQAEVLAELKAQRISQKLPEALVIGADQVLMCNDVNFDKPVDFEHAKAHLKALSGKSHELATAAVIAKGGQSIWRFVDVNMMAVRPLSDEFIDNYLEQAGGSILSSVGCYQLEGLGSQLFSRIDGDYFSILGLPLLQVLDFLRVHKVLAS